MATIQIEKLPPTPLTGDKVPPGYCKWCWKITDLPSPESLGLEGVDIALDFPDNTDILDPAGMSDAVKNDTDLGTISHAGDKVLVAKKLKREHSELRICLIARCSGGRNGEISLQTKLAEKWVRLPIDDQKIEDPDAGRKKNRWIPGSIE